MPSATRKTSTARVVAATLRQAGNLADHCCVVVANGLRARFFVVEETAHPRARYRLAERADLTNAESAARGVNAPGVRTERNTNRQLGPMHPVGEKRAQHRAEIERRFAQEITGQVRKLCGSWKTGVVILAANAKMLGMLRDGVRTALPSGVLLENMGRDYTALTPSALARQLKLENQP